MDKMIIFSGNGSKKLATKICKSLNVKMGALLVSRFSDGEIRVKSEEKKITRFIIDFPAFESEDIST